MGKCESSRSVETHYRSHSPAGDLSGVKQSAVFQRAGANPSDAVFRAARSELARRFDAELGPGRANSAKNQ